MVEEKDGTPVGEQVNVLAEQGVSLNSELAEVSELSLSERGTAHRLTASATAEKPEQQQRFLLTENVKEALSLAARSTGSDDPQVNFEFIAQQFSMGVAGVAHSKGHDIRCLGDSVMTTHRPRRLLF